MNVTSRLFAAALLSVTSFSILSGARTSAQAGAAAVEPLRFHHVHLNSVDPAAAAAYYPKPFALSTTRVRFNGFEGVKTGNIHLLFTKVAATPQNELSGPQTSVWHFGWNTPNSRQYNEKFRAIGERIRSRLLDARIEVVTGAGHAVHLEQPASVAAVLADDAGSG